MDAKKNWLKFKIKDIFVLNYFANSCCRTAPNTVSQEYW